MAPKENEQERREVIRRAQDEYLRAEAKALQTKAVADQAESDRLQAVAKHLRAQAAADGLQLGEQDCLEGWIGSGERVPMTPQPGGYAEDVYRCRNGHERRVRR